MSVVFATDVELAERIRRVAERLRDREPASADELLDVARILNPEREQS